MNPPSDPRAYVSARYPVTRIPVTRIFGGLVFVANSWSQMGSGIIMPCVMAALENGIRYRGYRGDDTNIIFNLTRLLGAEEKSDQVHELLHY